ncbi:MAG TPA: ATP-binding protein [Patescibacteria group bacterium]|nr:ATP-binding protein [Patescibacteria group bacterium]
MAINSIRSLSRVPARSTAAWLVAGLILAVIGQLKVDYDTALGHSEILVSAMANAIGQHLSGSIRSIDSLLDEAVDAVEAGRWDNAEFRNRMTGRLRSFPEIRYLGMVDAKGQLQRQTLPDLQTNDLPTDVSDRDYFVHQRDDAGQAPLYIGAPVLGRITGQRSIHLSRAIKDRHGRFAGVIIAAVNPDHYAKFLDTVLLEEAGGSAVIRNDGLILARAPDHVEKFGSDISSSDLFRTFMPRTTTGVGHLVSKADGNAKIIGYQVMADYPLIVTSGISRSKALHEWYRAVVTETLLVLVFSAAFYSWAHQTERARDEAQRASNAKSRFLAAASHDLRQPFQAMRLFHYVLTELCTSEREQTVLTSLDAAMQSGEELLNSLLDVSTLEAGQIQPHFAIFPINEVLQSKASEFATSAAQKGLRLRVVPCTALVNSDLVLLKRIVGNLLSNAVRYTHSGSIVLGCRRQGRFIRVEVWDTGIGIPRDKQGEIFDDFYQVGNSERDRMKGLGLGLSVVDRLARLLAHELKLRSSIGRGSVFTLAVPLADRRR